MTTSQLYCPHDSRRTTLRDEARADRNAIDWLEVLPSKRALIVHCVAELRSGLSAENVEITGGVRVVNPQVITAMRGDAAAAAPGLLSAEDHAVVIALAAPARKAALVVRTDSSGDYSTYTLRLLDVDDPADPAHAFDPLLREVDFSFKVDCPSDFDCRTQRDCPDELGPEPQLDYLAKDYASFRRLMLDRLAQTVPEWSERNPVDLGVTVVELIAFAADQLSYQQDAVATEAYLGSARLRASVRRHARLVDYHMHDGANARAWVSLTVKPGGAATVVRGTRIVSEGAAGTRPIEEAVAAGATVFETMHDADVDAQANSFLLHDWGDPSCCLPRGATRATLVAPAPGFSLPSGTVLILEEHVGPDDQRANANPAHRQAVRLREASTATSDPLSNHDLIDVHWYDDDALGFALRIGTTSAGADRAIAWGNVVLADHGLSVADAPVQVQLRGRFRPLLERTGLTQAMPYEHDSARREPAVASLALDLESVLPAIRLSGEDVTWGPQHDLISSDRFAPDFVVEMEGDGAARLRFGDDQRGRRPRPDSTFVSLYRIGSGPAGNVGAETLTTVLAAPADVAGARNPMAATGGTAPEPIEQVRLYAPQAFRRQERAVTEADYALAAERHPRVQRAAARRRWTGSWHTMFVTVDMYGGEQVDDAFRAELTRFLDRYRLAGYDLDVNGPQLVPLDISLYVCVEPGYVRSDVQKELADLLSARDLGGGRRGLFHPDNLTFGQPVRLSPVIAAAMGVDGVRRVAARRFTRFGSGGATEVDAPAVVMEELEIAQLENDPSKPEAGRVEFELEGGL